MSATLDELFQRVESMQIPEDFHVEIIEGQIVMSPQRATHWTIILLFSQALLTECGPAPGRVLSDVRIDFPGPLNGYAPDVALLTEDSATGGPKYHHSQVQLVVEVVSQSTRRDDYGIKLTTYATAEVPTYVIVDPTTAWIHVHSQPHQGHYTRANTYAFGTPLPLAIPPVTVDTSDWPLDT